MIGVIFLQIFLIFLNAVFASAEIAVISTNEAKLQKMSKEGNKKAKRLLVLTSQPARFLSTIQVAITLAGFLGSAFAAENFAEPLVDSIVKTGIGIPVGIINSVCVIIVTLILAYFNIVFGELIPKRIAMKKAEGLALSLSGVLRFVSGVFKPVVWLLTVSTNAVLKILGMNGKDEDEEVTSEEIIMLAETGNEQGFIENEENQFIKNLFEFKERTVGEVCTHRTETDFLYMDETDEEWKERIYKTYHNFYPVCGKSIDDVIGLISTKEYFRLEEKNRENVLKNAKRPVVFATENTPANDLFQRMRQTKEYFAVVVDEYGGVIGIVTLHDLLEELVGDLTDKGEELDYQIISLEQNKWQINGIAPIHEVEEALGISILQEEEDYETFGGYVFGQLDTLPEDGSTLSLQTQDLDIQVLKIEKHCVQKAIITLLKNEEQDE